MKTRFVVITAAIVVVVLFVWFQVRPSAIRSICQSEYNTEIEELKKVNAGFCLVAQISDRQLKEINIQLGDINSSWKINPNSPATCDRDKFAEMMDESLNINSFLPYIKYRKLTDEQKKLFRVAPSKLGEIDLYRKEAQATYDSCLHGYGL